MERPTKQDLKEYGARLTKHWIALTLFVVSTLLGSVQTIAQSFGLMFVIPSWVWFGIAFLIIFVSQLLVWLDIKRERDALRKYDVKQTDLRTLTEYRDKLIAHQNKPVPNETELGIWIEQYKQMRKEICEHIREKISPAEERLFDHLGVFRLEVLPQQTLNEEHLNWRSRAIRDHRWIEECVKDYGRMRYRQPSELLSELRVPVAQPSLRQTPNYEAWDQVNEFTLLQASFLWAEVEPFSTSLQEANGRAWLTMLEDAAHRNDLKVALSLDKTMQRQQGINVIDMHTRVSREALREFALKGRLNPRFLFPPTR